MRIIFFSSWYPPVTRGGAELSTHYIAQSLLQRGHDIFVLTSSNTSATKKEVVEGITVLRFPVPLTAKPLFERQVSRSIARDLQAFMHTFGQYDIVHAHDFRSALVLAEMKLPHAVVTVRDYASLCGTTNNLLADGTPGNCCSWPALLFNNPRIKEASWARKPFRMWQYKYNRRYRRIAFHRLKYHIFISEAQRAYIAEQQDITGIETSVIYNPVPEQYLKTTSDESITGNIVYAGTIEFYKGVQLLLQAWRRIFKEFPQAHLKIVGDGAQRKEYERYVERHRLHYQTTFTGKVPWNQLKSVYDSSSIVVAPHLWIEPFGRTVVEAMARGKIVVSANAGGPSEIIQNGITGLLFKRGSVADLEQKLREALTLNDLARRAMQQKARAWVSQHLNPDRIAAQHEEFYKKILKAP